MIQAVQCFPCRLIYEAIVATQTHVGMDLISASKEYRVVDHPRHGALLLGEAEPCAQPPHANDIPVFLAVARRVSSIKARYLFQFFFGGVLPGARKPVLIPVNCTSPCHLTAGGSSR